jgi:hypothetical protein
MRQGLARLAVLVGGLACGGVALAGAEHRTVPFRGTLEREGAPVNGAVAMTFRFFTAAEGGTALASSDVTLNGVVVSQGAFSVELPLTEAVLAADPVYVEITVGSATLASRQRIFPVPYAIRGRGDGRFVTDGAVRVGQNEDGTGRPAVAFARDTGDDGNAGTIVYKPAWDSGALGIVGAGNSPSRKVRVWDNLQVTQDLTANTVTSEGNITSQGAISGFGVVPVGSIIPWFKHMGGTALTLPAGWVECNGQVINDPDSSFNGKNVPDLNNARKFLRGEPSTGTTGASAPAGIGNHQHEVGRSSGGDSGWFYAWSRKTHHALPPSPVGLVDNGVWGGGGSSGDDDTVTFPTATGYTDYSALRANDDPDEASWPTYFTITWVMRTK